MTQAERRHDRLAVRLSLIISRLVAGETLSVRKLAAEFGVSVRTLRRDFRERLMYLDLEYQSGYCRLRTAGSETQMVPDVLIFAHRSGMAGLFPGFDRRLVNALLMCDESPCVIAPASPAPSPSGALSFWRLIQAITGRRRVTLIAEGQRCERLAPCRLLIHQQAWYLVAEHDGHIAVFTRTTLRAGTGASAVVARYGLRYQLLRHPPCLLGQLYRGWRQSLQCSRKSVRATSLNTYIAG